MAMCGNATTCAEFNTSGAEWFKIAGDARQAGNTSWVQQLISGSEWVLSVVLVLMAW